MASYQLRNRATVAGNIAVTGGDITSATPCETRFFTSATFTRSGSGSPPPTRQARQPHLPAVRVPRHDDPLPARDGGSGVELLELSIINDKNEKAANAVEEVGGAALVDVADEPPVQPEAGQARGGRDARAGRMAAELLKHGMTAPKYHACSA